MPLGDRTGPMGMGPQAGWRRAAMGWPAGPGFGPGLDAAPYGPAYAPGYAELSREQELDMLRGQVEAMEQGLKAAQKRISELESQPESAEESS